MTPMGNELMALTDTLPTRRLDNPDDAGWFWSIVDPTQTEDQDVQQERLAVALRSLNDQQLVDFIALFESVTAKMYSWRLWAAAYVIDGGCSDDGFIDFRSWLIARGRTVADAAVLDPDSLARLAIEPDSASFESFAYVMDEEFERRSGANRNERLGDEEPASPRDPDWDFDFDDTGEMQRRLPQLAAAYLS